MYLLVVKTTAARRQELASHFPIIDVFLLFILFILWSYFKMFDRLREKLLNSYFYLQICTR